MRRALTFGLIVLLSGCASEYSEVPEARGEWMPANPPSLITTAPAVQPAVRPVAHAYWTNTGLVP